jgi:hypothetical protein
MEKLVFEGLKLFSNIFQKPTNGSVLVGYFE